VVAARQRVLFLNSSSLHPHFMAYFGDRELPRDRARWRGFEVELVRDANHIFSFDHARAALASAVERMALRAAVEPPAEEPAPAAGWDRLAHLARRALARTSAGGPA
jgi:hypothetical protein